MNQAMVPVDGHKEEPQICVIEASMELYFFISLYPYEFFKKTFLKMELLRFLFYLFIFLSVPCGHMGS